MTVYSVPVHIEIGPDSLEQLPDLLKQHGKRVLLVHGHRPVEDGLLQTVRTLLNKAGFPHSNMGQILPNPKYGSVKRGIRIAQKDHCDIILALGGGSTLQCAKAVALGAKYDGDVWDFWTGKKEPEDALVIASVMTNPSSSSELRDSVTMVRKGEQKTIHTPYAQCAFAILDPKLSMYPPYPTMCQSMSLLADLTQAWLEGDDMERTLDSMLMKKLFESADALYKDSHDIESRNNLYWTGLLAHSTKLKTKSDLNTLANALSFAYSLPLGTALSALYPSWLGSLEKSQKEDLAKMGQELSGDASMDAAGCIAWLKEKVASMHLPLTLPETGAVLDGEMLKAVSKSKEQYALLCQANKSSK